MKVVIQNGCAHALSRKEIESMVGLFPDTWSKNVKTIALYQGKDPGIFANYFRKEQILGLYSPKESKNKEAKIQAVQEMIIALECIAGSADFPKNMSKAVRTMMLEKTSQVRERCMLLVSDNAT